MSERVHNLGYVRGIVVERVVRDGVLACACSGKMCYVNGEVYDGHWKQDSRHGMGTYYFRNGTSFSGMWVDGLPAEKSEVLEKAFFEIPTAGSPHARGPLSLAQFRTPSVASLPDVHLHVGGSESPLSGHKLMDSDGEDAGVGFVASSSGTVEEVFQEEKDE